MKTVDAIINIEIETSHTSTKGEKEMMTEEKKEELLTRMIRIYGFEHHDTIQFAKFLERNDISENTLESMVRSHERCPNP